jgi:hypothetical protein
LFGFYICKDLPSREVLLYEKPTISKLSILSIEDLKLLFSPKLFVYIGIEMIDEAK